MSRDAWLAPGTCGVKLAEFERITQQMTQAAPKLRELADALWQALNGAGVSTAPAMEVKRIAAWADEAASDLRRRCLLVHDLDRQKLAFTICRPDGTYRTLPDRYTDQVAHANGRRSAELFRRAASGDASAQAALRRLRPGDITPMFAKALLESLRPEELLKLPMALAQRLAGDIGRQRPSRDAHAADTRATLALLGRSLALATDPGGKGYLGDDYLSALREAGRTNLPPLSTPPNGTSGYQSLATLIGSAGDVRFSTRFIDLVGNDMIAYDSGLRKTLGQAPLPDLTGKYALGNALDPSTTTVTGGERKTDFLAPLLEAAAVSGTAASQALLNHRAMGPVATGPQPRTSGTNLQYLLHDRRSVWAESDHGAALGKTIRSAATGQDPESTRLAFAAAQILATDARKNVEVKDGKFQVGDRGPFDAIWHGELGDALARPHHYDELSGLRPAMAHVLVAHLDRLHDIVRLSGYDERPGSTGLTADDLDYLLLDVTRNAEAYETLLMGQLAHAKISINRTVTDSKALSNAVTGEGWMFGHLLEARHQSVGAEEARLAEDLERMRKYVGYGVGLIPVGTEVVAQRVPVAGQAYGDASAKVSGLMTGWLAKRMADKADPTILAPTTETEAVERLFNQMIASALVSQGRFSTTDLAGRSFATHGPHPKIRPIDSMTASQLEALLRWADENSGISDLRNDVTSSSSNGAREAAGHFRGSDGHHVSPSDQ